MFRLKIQLLHPGEVLPLDVNVLNGRDTTTTSLIGRGACPFSNLAAEAAGWLESVAGEFVAVGASSVLAGISGIFV